MRTLTALTLTAPGSRQEAVPGGDADDGSMLETEVSPTSKGDGSTEPSWSSTPVSREPVTVCDAGGANVAPHGATSK